MKKKNHNVESKKKWLIYLLLVTSIGASLYLMSNWVGNDFSSNDLAPTSVQPAASSSLSLLTPSQRRSVTFPKTENWVKYDSRCLGLAEVNVYYPESWKLGKEGEQRIADAYENTVEGKKQYGSQCLIQFGYPMAPNGRQDSWVKEMVGEITIEGQNFPDLGGQQNIADYVKYGITDNLKGVKYIVAETINGREWTVVNNTDWVILNKGKVYHVQLWLGPDGEELEPYAAGHMVQVAEEFVRRIEFK